MILKQILGENWGVIDRYATRAKHSRLLASSFGGDTVAERMREATALRSSRPNLRKVVGHIILAHDPELTDLTDEQWLVAIEIARLEHDLRDAAFCAVLHQEKNHRHVHLYYVRCRPDGSVVSDSQSYRKNESAGRRIEQELGLPPPTPVPKEKKVGDRRRSDNATRRGRRKQQTEGETFMETTELSRLTFEAIAASSSTEAFKRELAARGIGAEWSPNHSGIKLLPAGASTWQKGSTVSRELSGAKIIAALQRNADLRSAAEVASAAAIGVADHRAKALTPTRLDRDEAAAGVASRALPPPHADAARAQADAGPDPLAFLSPRPPEQGSALLDDAALTSAGAAGGIEEEDARDRSKLDRQLAEEEFGNEFKAMTAKQLIELRNVAKRPLDEAIFAFALLEKLLALVLRFFSFGLADRATPISLMLQQRQAVADAAEDEIARRHRSPATVAERVTALKNHEAALRSKLIQVDADKTAVALSSHYESARLSELRTATAQSFNAAQVKRKKPTTLDLESELAVHDAVISSLLVPSGLGKLKRAANREDWNRKLARAQQLRELTTERLRELLDLIEADVQNRQAAKQDKVVKESQVLKDETEALRLELKDRVSVIRKEIERDAERERLGNGVGDTEVDTSRNR